MLQLKTDMKGTLKLFILPLLFISFQAFAVPYAVFNHKIFYVPGKGPVVETYFDIYGKSVTLMKLEDEVDAFQGEVELTIIFKQNGEIVTYDKKSLKTPVMSMGNIVDFIDVQRFALPSGKYDVEIELKDLNAEEASSTTKATVDLVVPQVPQGPFFSDIELVSAYKKTTEPGMLSRSGYDLLPMVSDSILKAEMKELVVYAELYGSEEKLGDDMFLISTYLAEKDSAKPIESTRKYLRRNTGVVVPVLTTLPLTEVGQGEYLVVIEARTRDNDLFATMIHEIRRDEKQVDDILSLMKNEDIGTTWVSKFQTKASIYDYIHSLRPIATMQEKNMLSNSFRDFEQTELEYMQNFMYAFWESRNPRDGERAWLDYKPKVDFVNEEFGTINKQGYETDRGRVYLQYGAPDDLTDRANEPSSYPYQIWRYYKAGQFNNVRFVFYDPTLMTVDYELLHAEGIRGEINNPQWRLLLEQRNTPMNNVDRRDGREHFGGRVDDFFDNPR